jgi:acyl dehydratase
MERRTMPEAREVKDVGTRYPGYEFPIERGKIREFARATMSENPDYLDDPRPVITPTGLMVGGSWAPDDSASFLELIDFDPVLLLHGAQEFRFPGIPPRAGDVLTAATRVDKRYEKEGRRGGTMRFAEIVTEYRNPEGALVAEARMTLIETARPATEA